MVASNVNNPSIVESGKKRPLTFSHGSETSPYHEAKKQNLNVSSQSSPNQSSDHDIFNISSSTSEIYDSNFKDFVIEALQSPQIRAIIDAEVKRRVDEKVSDLMNEIKVLRSDYIENLSFMQGCVDTLTATVQDLEKQVESQEQYSRRQSLRIQNNWPEQPGEDTDEMVVRMARDLLGVDIDKEQINRSHRVGRHRGDGKPRPVIVKFVSHCAKSKVYHARKRLNFAGPRARGVHIHEDLTKTRNKMFATARNLLWDNLICDTWTEDGIVYVRTLNGNLRAFGNKNDFYWWEMHLRKNPPKTYSQVVLNV